MKLNRVRLQNFGPYYANQEIDLSVSQNAPIVVIYGENLHGKTSLLRAIRWGLYAEAVDQRNKPLPFSELVNYDAQAEGTWLARVELEFIHEGRSYKLERQIQANREPRSDADFTMIKTLRIDESFVPTGQIEDTIAGILHKDISSFFLFDGEMLNRYEDLLIDESRSSLVIKRSIEQILGLPALQAIHADLTELERAATRRQTKLLEAERRDVTLAREVEGLASQRDSIQQDLVKLNELLDQEQGEKEEIRTALQRYSDIEALARELNTLAAEVDDLQGRRADKLAHCRAIITKQWWLPLAPVAANKLDAAQVELAATSAAFARNAETAQLATALAKDTCPTCGAYLDDERHAEVQHRVDKLAEQTKGPPVSPERLIELTALVRQLSETAQMAPAQAFAASEREYRRLAVDVRRKQRRIDEIREDLRGHEETVISSLQHKYDAVVLRIDTIGEQIKHQEEMLTDVERTLKKKRAQIRNEPGANQSLVAEAGAYEALRDIFSRAVDRFREKLRDQVESAATDIFTHLITAGDLNSLQINDQYGLRVVTDDGRVLTTRSAGTSQIVALSLIGALNRCAVREGPVVMDTPFGRLDRSHRKNILQYIPKFGPQVVLLVQSGELERERDLGHLGAAVSREYELVRVDGKSTRTEVRPIG